MKDYYERDATSTWYAVVYTPKTKRGLSLKLLFSWHGPYTIVAQTSPVDYVLRVADNRRISTTVHVSHMKPYVDPASRPIRCPPEDVDDSFLLEPTWEPLEIILDPSLILKYYQDHPSAKNIVHHAISSAEQTSPDIPVIAAFSLCYRPIPTVTTHPQVEPISPPVKSVEPIFRHYRPFSSVYLLSFALLLLVDVHPSTVHSTQFDPNGKVITFYPDSLMLSSNPQVLAFYEDTTLVSVHVDLNPHHLGPVPVLNNTFSPQQKRFYDQLL